jgi:S-adenosylmethionine-dependent methyltransferase
MTCPLDDLFTDEAGRKRALAAEPGFHNVIGIENAFAKNPLEMDFLDEISPYHLLKAFSERIYSDFFDRYLDVVPREARVLEAGCGIGRFTRMLARRFSFVTAFDASPTSLNACRKHIEDDGLGNVLLHRADVSFISDEHKEMFDLVFATEFICYVSDPAAALKRLAYALKPGGRILLSVEGRPGALAVRGSLGTFDFPHLLGGAPLIVENDCYVHFFDAPQLRSLLEQAGLSEIAVRGCHYLTEGSFWNLVDDARLSDPEYAENILRAEEACRSDPVVAPWARVFCASGRKL